jgi:hypothetical protein
MDQLDAAIVTLQSPELASNTVQPWTARLRYAYADALLAAGREAEAREWFAKAVESDKDGSTDASDRLAEMDGVEFVDAFVEDDDEDDDERDDDVQPQEEASAPDEAEAEVDIEDDEDDDEDEDDDDIEDVEAEVEVEVKEDKADVVKEEDDKD